MYMLILVGFPPQLVTGCKEAAAARVMEAAKVSRVDNIVNSSRGVEVWSFSAVLKRRRPFDFISPSSRPKGKRSDEHPLFE